jgi:hypothetical protein
LSHISDGITASEGKAAFAILHLAASLQDAAYYCPDGIALATIRALHKAYRVLKPIALYYHQDHGLLWDPPDTRFKPKGKS